VGWSFGYDVGYVDGWYSFGFKPGSNLRSSTASQSRMGNLVSMLTNDLVDVSKIKAPKLTADGKLVVNGKVIFEDTVLVSRDVEKISAAAEKYLVAMMGKQINAKFGLSIDRSMKVAKISNHWRKFSTSRAITDKDASAFSDQLIGANIKDIEVAVKKSMQGEAGDLNTLISKAAQVNGTTPEHISMIMNQLFF
jgi:hypothetical protein